MRNNSFRRVLNLEERNAHCKGKHKESLTWRTINPGTVSLFQEDKTLHLPLFGRGETVGGRGRQNGSTRAQGHKHHQFDQNKPPAFVFRLPTVEQT